MTETNERERVVERIWRKRLEWSKAADRLKARVGRARATALALGIAGAVLATAATTLMPSGLRTPCALAGALSLAVGTYVMSRLVTPQRLRSWTRARSVSEAIKTEVWSFRAKVEPYAGDDAPLRLVERVEMLEAQATDLEPILALVRAEVPSVLPKGKQPPTAMSAEQWVERRVLSQSEGYYRKAARNLARRLASLRDVEITLGLLATAASAVAAWSASQPQAATRSLGLAVGPWVAVLTTVGAAIAAHIAANRYDFLVMSYGATARRLEHLVDRWKMQGKPTDERRWSAFVHDCEAAISVENEGWLARWAEGEPQKPTGGGAAWARVREVTQR
jgi:hypothetical protein